jgi:hypothetical protein
MSSTKALRVASVGLRFNDPRVLDLNFRSSQTWIDRDILLIRLSEIQYEYATEPYSGTYKGAWSLDDDDSVRIQEDFRRRRAELLELLKLGRTVVMFLAPPTHWYVDSGERKYSGTGRNQRTTRVVSRMELYSLLPFELQATSASTRDLELVAGEPFAGFWRVMRDRFEAAARLTAPLGKATLKISGADAIVSTIVHTKEGGVVILLPQDLLYYDADARVETGDGADSEDDVDEERDDDEERSEEDKEEDEDEDLAALEDDDDVLGPRVEDVAFLDALFELIRALRADTGDFEQPVWATRYSFDTERDAAERTTELETAASAALAELDSAKSRLAELLRRKTLITGTGKALEIVAQDAFEALGFRVEEGDSGRTDRVMRIDGFPPIVMETKGPSKSAAEADSAQLEKWVSEHFVKEGVQPKGLLLANAWRDLPLSERTGAAFPDQMLSYASSRGHCLLTGVQLLGAWLDVEANPTKREEIVQSLYDAVGRYPLYTDWSDFLEADNAHAPDETDQ